MLMMGWGMQRALYGEEASWAGFALAAVLGQMNLAGGGIGTITTTAAAVRALVLAPG